MVFFFAVAAVTFSLGGVAQAAGPFPDTPITGYPQANSAVRSIVVAPNGSQYVAGDFTQIGGENISYMARVLANGTVDSSFDLDIDGTVDALALSDDGTILYAAGSFTNVNGATARNGMAAFNTATGIATAFNADVSGATTLALDSDSNILYIGGWFGTVNGGTTRNYLAALNGTTGVATAFDPNPSDTVTVIAFDTTSDTLYVGGNFTNIDSTARNFLAALDTSGNLTAFTPTVAGAVDSMALDTVNDLIYTSNTTTVRSFNTSDGSAGSFNETLTGSYAARLIVDTAASTLYVAGDFTGVDGGTTRNRLAVFDIASGVATSFNPNFGGSIVNTMALDSTNNRLYVGGTYTTVGGNARTNLAAFEGPTPAPSPSPGTSSSSSSSSTLADTGQPTQIVWVLAILLIATGAIVARHSFLFNYWKSN